MHNIGCFDLRVKLLLLLLKFDLALIPGCIPVLLLQVVLPLDDDHL
jgi:hypothetical protein